MSDNKKRAIRRAHVDRLKKARSGYYGYNRVMFRNEETGEVGTASMDDRQLGKVVHTPKCCSCYRCGNPRKWRTGDFKNGQDYKERAADEAYHAIECSDLEPEVDE